MGKNRPDIIELLEEEKAYYAEQIKRVNIALAALKGEIPESSQEVQAKQSPTKNIGWTKHLLRLFNNEHNLTINEVCNKLAENGISEALDSDYRNTINSILYRLVRKGKLTKDDDGRFNKKREKIIIDDNQNENDSASHMQKQSRLIS